MVKDKIEIRADLDDTLFVIGAALRYALGRRTYAVNLISSFIKSNLSLYNEKWLLNNLRDINDYEKQRKNWNPEYGKYDDDFDYEDWMNLKEALLNKYAKGNFEQPVQFHGIEV
jgi:hypothetical protein